MQRVGWSVWKQAQKSLDPARGCTFVANGISLQSWPRASSNSTWVCRPFSSSSDGEPPKDDDGKPPRPKKLRRRARYGTYDKSFEDELDMVPLEEGITHLYNARGIVDKWLGHPTLDAIFPDKDLYAKGKVPNVEPPGEGPILRWETRVVLSPGGQAWHPANRKVKVSVYLKDLGLTPQARERMLLLVGKRYKPNNDELTITSERFDLREENRKDVLRTLYALIDEANTANWSSHGQPLQSNTVAATSS
ncbi:unnamed protein product [Sphagnum jensenii]|uniref:Small ribosomal subunit protein mS35 mitochondrial conserved domain-containing protein n=1 Tax=Sphagnum jensenii TaxID=128206 RepID=A0ABP1AYX3_9BRYO